MTITIDEIRNIKIESKQDFIATLDLAIELAYELHRCIDAHGANMYAQSLPKAA